jgi:hypothetical protein
MIKGFPRVAERFPQQAELVQRLARESEAFLSLCEDYTLLIETLAQLRMRHDPGSRSAVDDYLGYLLELELDIADALALWITDNGPVPKP